MHLILFDIDGTLVDSHEFDAELFVRAVRTVLGIGIGDDWSSYRNVTDGGILDEIIDGAGLRSDRTRIHREVRDTFAGLVSEYLEEQGGHLPEIPGAHPQGVGFTCLRRTLTRCSQRLYSADIRRRSRAIKLINLLQVQPVFRRHPQRSSYA